MPAISHLLQSRTQTQILQRTQAGRHEVSAQETLMRGDQVQDIACIPRLQKSHSVCRSFCCFMETCVGRASPLSVDLVRFAPNLRMTFRLKQRQQYHVVLRNTVHLTHSHTELHHQSSVPFTHVPIQPKSSKEVLLLFSDTRACFSVNHATRVFWADDFDLTESSNPVCLCDFPLLCFGSCTREPVFGYPGQTRRACAAHKSPKMESKTTVRKLL